MYLTPKEFVQLARAYCRRRRPGVPPSPPFFRLIFVREGTHMTAVFVFDVPAPPVHPGDAVTGRALSYTIDGVSQPDVAPSLTDVSFTIPTAINPGQVVTGTLVDTNATGAGTAATAQGTAPFPGQSPPAPTGFSVQFTA